MRSPRITTPPKAPSDYTPEMAARYKDACIRIIDAAHHLYKQDLVIIDAFVKAHARWDQVRDAMDKAPLLNEKGAANSLIRTESELGTRVKSTYRAIESTIRERMAANRMEENTNQVGGQTGVRAKPGRPNVPHKGAKTPDGISWLDEIKRNQGTREH